MSNTKASTGKASTGKVNKREINDLQVSQTKLAGEKAELVKAALLGTQRYELNIPDATSGLGKLHAELASADPPHRLLSLAGAYYLRQRAGVQPAQISSSISSPSVSSSPVSSPPVSSPPVSSPSVSDPSNLESQSTADSGSEQLAGSQRVCNKPASQNLAAMLWGYAPDLLGEFLSALAKNNQLVPNQYLPIILARGAKSTALRLPVLSVLGQSGHWLAAQNPAWAYATYHATTYDGAQELLKQLPSAKRQPFLRQLRQTDPALVRELLRNQWKSLSSSDRALFIKIMDEGLTIEDEPFLESTLNDRNNVVRRKSAELLAKLPDSQLCARMIENTEGFLTWEPEKEIRITVKFPAEITPQMVQDGVMIRKLRDESRVRAYQMKEMIGAIPLEHWSRIWQATPAEIIAAARTSRWPRTLKQSFVIAAERQKNVEWAEALLVDDQYGVSSIRLINLLPIEACEKVLKSMDADAKKSASTKRDAKKSKSADDSAPGDSTLGDSAPDDSASGDSAPDDSEQSVESPPLTKDSFIVRILRKRKDPWTEEIFTYWIDRLIEHLIYDIAQREAAEKQQIQDADPVQNRADKKPTPQKTASQKPTAQKTIAQKATATNASAVQNQVSNLRLKRGSSGNVNHSQSVDSILRLLIRQSGRCAPVEMTPQVVEKLRPFIQEFNVWRPLLQELISTLKFRQAMLKNIETGNIETKI